MVKVNQVILPKDDSKFPESRIVRIDANAGNPIVWLFRLQGDGAFPQRRFLAELELEITNKSVSIDTWAPKSALLDETKLSRFQAKSLAAGKAVFEQLRGHSVDLNYLFDDKARGPLIQAVASTLDIQRVEVWRAIYRWWRNGMTDAALIPTSGFPTKGKKSKEGQRRRGPRIEGVSSFCLTDKVLTTAKTTIRREAKENIGKEGIFRKVTAALGEIKKDPSGQTILVDPEPDRAVSWAQYLRIYAEMNVDGSLDRRREGPNRWDLDHSTSLMNAQDQLSGPGSEYQIDDSGCQVEVVDPTGQAIGPLFIILVIDTWSNLITGFHADLGSATNEAYAIAFYNSVIDKVAFCKYYGINITSEDWPASGVSRFLCKRSVG